MLRVLHSSDLHNAWEPLLAFPNDFDVWLDTGDFFPNQGRVARTGYRIDPRGERRFQMHWLAEAAVLPRLRQWLDGRPALLVPGNHDFISLASLLRRAGADARPIRPDGLRMFGLTWAGFREVPWMSGEWAGELHDLGPLVGAAMACEPDILATHAPPIGVLDSPGLFGIPRLAEAIAAGGHRIRAHFFGHEHDDGGRWTKLGETLFVNAAAAIVIVSLPVPVRSLRG